MPNFEDGNELVIFKQILDTLPNSIYIKDTNGRYVWLNKKSIEQLKSEHLIFDSIIGKTDFEVFSETDAIAYVKNDKVVIETNKGISIEEEVILPDGRKLIQLSFKEPLYKKDSSDLIGVLGYTIDITDLKKKQEEITRLQLENEYFKDQEKFIKLANQVVHDIRSPLASLLMIVKSCTDIPEQERIALREAAISIGDIANNLLGHYQKNESENLAPAETHQPILMSVLLLQILTDKKYQYRHLDVRFTSEFSPRSYFAFIRADQSTLKRMLSNLINNAVEAFGGGSGNIFLKLDADNERVKITILDDGKGMSSEMVEKIMSRIAVTAGKESGHGIGFTQIWETIDCNQGELSIYSKSGKGTAINISFPKVKAPSWMAEKIPLKKGDTVIILDDDASIHGAWNTHFESVIGAKHNIQLKHFQDGKEALTYIQSLPNAEREKVFLLTDYELLKQELNGLHIISMSKIYRSILVTSHFSDPLIRKQAAKINTKILPKHLASEVLIEIREDNVLKEKNMERVEFVLLDDNEQFVNSFILSILKNQEVDSYNNPEHFLKIVSKYSKKTKFFIDNNYSNSDLKGLEIAEQLCNQGYEYIYILSGEEFDEEQIPNYVTIIRKNDVDRMKMIIDQLKA